MLNITNILLMLPKHFSGYTTAFIPIPNNINTFKIFFLLDAAVLRIPVLYGDVERLEESAVTVMFDKVQFSNKSANMDHWQQRFPTNVKDVATVCRQLAEKRMLVRI